MNKKNFIQVFEHETLRYSDDSGFKKSHFEAMVQFNERNQNKYFTIVHKGVKFKSYVGVIQVSGITIEILPKADNNEVSDKNLWQGVLIHMLRVCKNINVDNISETNLQKRYNSILEIYFDIFLNEIDALIRRGLIKKYRKKQSNQLALKGKLVFSKNIQKNLIHKERFYCEHQVYDKDHLLHQILYQGLLVLQNLKINGLTDKLNRVLYEFSDIKKVKIGKDHFSQVVLSRMSISYSKAIEISKMLILNYSPNLNSGKDNMLTLLFDMNSLWEEFIYRVLQNHKPEGYSVLFQNSAYFWEGKKIRPDIVIKDDNSSVYVIDTKWKIVEDNNPSDDDLKQMFAYNLHWRSERSLLLYPRTTQEDLDYGNYHFLPYYEIDQDRFTTLKNKCMLGFVSVIESRSLRESHLIAEEIFGKLSIH